MIRPELPVDPVDLPPLPDSFGAALDPALVALGLRLDRDARQAIDTHVRLLLAWNDAINLTAITDPATIAIRHVLDSLAAVPLVGGEPRAAETPSTRTPPSRRPSAPTAAVASSLRLADIGSGAGFPGLALAVALPGSQVTLIESVAKKARFLEAATLAMALADRVAIRPSRAEEVAAIDPAAWDIVTVRAVAGLGELVELAMPLLRLGGRLLAWKGPDIEAELAAGGRAARALGGAPPVIHEVSGIPGLAGHRIVVVRKIATTPPGYPRDPARRKRLPW